MTFFVSCVFSSVAVFFFTSKESRRAAGPFSLKEFADKFVEHIWFVFYTVS